MTTINGNNLNNTLSGSDLDETYNGFAGNDTITALGGNDFVYAGDDNDTVFGGKGDDIFVQDASKDTDSFYGGAGNDEVDLSSSIVGWQVDGGLGTGVSGSGRMTQTGSNVRIDAGCGDIIIIENTTRADFTDTDFNFV